MLDRLARARRHVIALHERQVPRFGTGADPGDPRVYYVAPDRDRPTGGVRVIYRHVDVLNALGIPATVMHSRPGFSCSWFAHETPVVAGREARLGPADILVVPEWYGPSLHRVPSGPRLVVFNQRAYDTFDHIDFDRTRAGAPYVGLGSRLLGLLAVSQDNADFLSYAFPGLKVAVTRNVIDPQIFHPRRQPGQRGRQIAVVPTRRREELMQLKHILRSRGVLDRWLLAPIHHLSERETADVMRDSPLFLSLSDREGFGLPPAEAMASGCYVVGYPGLAGREFFDPELCTPVADGDLIGLARAVEQACGDYERHPEAIEGVAAAASARICATYDVKGLSRDLSDFYLPLMQR